MDPRLEEASHAGDVEALHRLLQEDSLLFEQFSATTPSVADNPLHIAALIGHAAFVREVLRLKPSLARGTNANGLTPLHLASARGRLAVVRELLNVSGGSDLCGICDRDGLMPIHTAAAKGRTDVLVELMNASPDSVRQLTRREETTVHWAVRSGCYKAVEVLVARIDTDEVSFLNSKDDKGNTIMHLAAAMRQFQIVNMLSTKQGMKINEVNARGLTVLDVLLESPNECRDMALAEMILAAGGKTASRREKGTRSDRTFQYLLQLSLRIILWLGLSPSACRPNSQEKESTTPQTLMVVSTLIAMITFQPVLNPPGGFDKRGRAIQGNVARRFLVFDMVGLFASLSIILLLICVHPGQKKKLMKILVWVMWIAVYSTALAFGSAALIVFPGIRVVRFLVDLWTVVYQITVLWVYFRLAIYLFYLVGWWEPLDIRTSRTARAWIALTIGRVFVSGVTVVAPFEGPSNLFGYFELVFLPQWSRYLARYWYMMMELPQVYLALRFTVYILWSAKCYVGKKGENHQSQARFGVMRTTTIAATLIAATINVAGFFIMFILISVVMVFVGFQFYFIFVRFGNIDYFDMSEET